MMGVLLCSNSISKSTLYFSPSAAIHGSRRATNEKLDCSNCKLVEKHRRWNLELGFRAPSNIVRNAGPFPEFRVFPRGDRREAGYCCSKKRSSDGLEEPVEDSVDKSLHQDEKCRYSLGNALEDKAAPANGLANAQGRISRRVGLVITAGHFFLAAGALVLVDAHNLKTLPQSVVPCSLTSPFLVSAALTAVLGYFFVPVLKYFKAAQIFRIEGPTAHVVKTGTPTMGGLFFVPVGVAIAGLFTGFNSIEVQGAITVTLAFAGVGLMDDGLAFWRKHNYGLPGGIKFTLQVAVGIFLFFWLEFASLPSPYKMKHVVWLPAPFGSLQLGKWYLPLTAFCCAAMSNGVNLTDGLDGLAGGTAAFAFLGISFAVFPNFPALGVFGSSMAGACFGFLVHNCYKAKVFMGDTGSLALGGALAAMACCTGMFVPLFIASGVFVIETISVMGQVFYFKLTKRLYGEGRRWLKMAPFHHHLELVGLKEPVIITLAYSVSIALAILAAYVTLVNC